MFCGNFFLHSEVINCQFLSEAVERKQWGTSFIGKERNGEVINQAHSFLFHFQNRLTFSQGSITFSSKYPKQDNRGLNSLVTQVKTNERSLEHPITLYYFILIIERFFVSQNNRKAKKCQFQRESHHTMDLL